MSEQGTRNRLYGSSSHLGLFDLLKVIVRLGPKQLRDELRLAQQQMKTKGVEVGIGAALAVAGLVFLSLMVIALVVLVVVLFAKIMPMWAAALVTAGIFLVLAALLALFGVGKIKAAMPLMPEDAIRGLQYDAAVMKEGRAFNARDFDRERRRAAKEREQQRRREAQQKQASGPRMPAPSYHELLRRTTARRNHLAQLRDDALRKVGIDPKMPNKGGKYSVPVADTPAEANVDPTQRPSVRTPGLVNTSVHTTRYPETAVSSTGEITDPVEKAKYIARERWQDLAVAGVSSAAFAVLVRKIFKN
ncbi:phage holin family protein [Micrococcoides hystricis]|uniref:Phage holin family protein n=1 Tax=Micrococcoides hystricis TaxID=1572761 RepID=A0ABV6P8R2_9MICC